MKRHKQDTYTVRYKYRKDIHRVTHIDKYIYGGYIYKEKTYIYRKHRYGADIYINIYINEKY